MAGLIPWKALPAQFVMWSDIKIRIHYSQRMVVREWTSLFALPPKMES